MEGASVDELTDAEGHPDPDAIGRTIDEIAREAEAAWNAWDPPTDPPDEDQALRSLREGAGRAIGVYVLLRTGGRNYRFSEAEFAALEDAMNCWLGLYARAYGVDMDPACSLRTGAEALIETRDITDVAELLTGVPGNDS